MTDCLNQCKKVEEDEKEKELWQDELQAGICNRRDMSFKKNQNQTSGIIRCGDNISRGVSDRICPVFGRHHKPNEFLFWGFAHSATFQVDRFALEEKN